MKLWKAIALFSLPAQLFFWVFAGIELGVISDGYAVASAASGIFTICGTIFVVIEL